MNFIRFILVLLSSITAITTASLARAQTADGVPQYHKQPGVAGSITSVGSDTLATLMSNWSGEFKRLYPQVKFQIQASGSSTAPPALSEGTANVGPMSRKLKTSEINDFVQQHGYRPLAIVVAIDAIALYVDTANPISGLTVEQVDGMFSATRYCGAQRPIEHWTSLNLAANGRYQRIKLFGRNSVSGTYGLFKSLALCDGDFRNDVNELLGSASVVQSVAYSNGAIGYAAYGHKTAAVRALPISQDNGQFVKPTAQSIRSGRYPFSRFLFLVVNKEPDRPLPLLEKEFLRFVLSQQGQKVVEQEGYVSLTSEMTLEQLEKVIQD